MTSWDAFEGGYEDPFASDRYAEEGRTRIPCGFRESWDFFRREIKTRSRFFGRFAQRALEEMFGDLASLKTWNGIPAIKEIPPTDEVRFIYRARIAYAESELREMLSDPVKNSDRRLHASPARVAWTLREFRSSVAPWKPIPASRRRARPWVAVSCSGVSRSSGRSVFLTWLC